MGKINLQQDLMDQKMKVDFNTYDMSIKELVSLVAEKILNIAPAYQRQFRWDEERQSSLIESLFLGIPIPSLFAATNTDGSWELIDGVQRLSSIIHFAATQEEWERIYENEKSFRPLKLVGLKKLNNFNGKLFSDLQLDLQLKFKLASLKVTTLTDKSDMQVRFDLFERLNRGGVILTDQEIRSCVYHGEFNDFLKEMAENADFKKCVRLNKKQENDGTREELVLRFFAFFYEYENFQHSVVDFLNDYMEKASNRFNYEYGEKLFKEVFKLLNNALEKGLVRSQSTTPLNLFEGVAVGAARAYKEKRHLNTSHINEWISGDELRSYTTGATNSKTRVKGRIEFCKERFIE